MGRIDKKRIFPRFFRVVVIAHSKDRSANFKGMIADGGAKPNGAPT